MGSAKNKCDHCSYSGWDPDTGPWCNHPKVTETNLFGLVLGHRLLDKICGKKRKLFEQHPLRPKI